MWVQEVATIVGMFLADKVGRRNMLIQTTFQSLIAQAILAGILAKYTNPETVDIGPLPSRAAIILVNRASWLPSDLVPVTQTLQSYKCMQQ